MPTPRRHKRVTRPSSAGPKLKESLPSAVPVLNERYFNRDLSLLKFNRRVLAQAADKSMPLLERARFLAIFSSNMDEFFMKRIGYLKRLRAKGAARVGADGASPGQVLQALREEISRLFDERQRLWSQELRPALAQAGVRTLDWAELSPDERIEAEVYFRAEVFPVLTPLAVDPAHPFPFLSNLSLSLGVKLNRPEQDEPLFARVKIPDMLPQWVRLKASAPEGELRLARLQDVIVAHLGDFFPQMTLREAVGFRVLRSADTDQVIEEADDLADMVEEELRLRRMAEIVALQHGPNPDAWVRGFLRDELALDEDDFYPGPGELNWLALNEIANLPLPALRFKPWTPLAPLAFQAEEGELFRVLRDHDELVQLPYDSFQATVESLLRNAARDPDVLAIKIALYRLGDDNPLVPLLIRAAESGKQVVCVVELKARFDEARNLYWSEQLERAGVHVVYGVVGLKTHSKICLVVRREKEGYRFYGHIGTGNYNPATAKLYSDFGLFTCDPAITGEMIEIFNYLTGLSLRRSYQRFLLAPINMRARFLELIGAETAAAKAGKPAQILAKMNSLEDPQITEKLYEASQAGVQIDLIVRGLCCLRPGVPSMSKNIRVRSLVGRFLEHSRLYYFRQGAQDPLEGAFYIGSADWMTRNLNNRVETAVPIVSRSVRQELWDVAQLYLADSGLAWVLGPDGEYSPPPGRGKDPGLHEKLMQRAKERLRGQ